MEVQARYRRFRKDNPRARNTKRLLDFGAPIVGTFAGFLLDPAVGTIVGFVVGVFAGQLASRLASKAMGWD